MLECKWLENDLAKDKCTLGELKGLSTNDLCNWLKTDSVSYGRYAYLGLDKYVDFKKELCFQFEKCARKKQQSVFLDHLK